MSVMEIGFLDTEFLKPKLVTDTDTFDGHSIYKDNGKENGEISTGANDSNTYLPLLDLHSVHPDIKPIKPYPKDKKRFIFRHWPRDPDGKILQPYSKIDFPAKEAGNHLVLWGATLYDFYLVRCDPLHSVGYQVFSGSKLTSIMEELGELEHARDEIAWAAREPFPVEIPVWDPAKAVVAHERRVHTGFGVIDGVKINKKRSTVPEVSAEPAIDGQTLDIFEPVRPEIEPNIVKVPKDPPSGDRTNEPCGKSVDAMRGAGMHQLLSEIPIESPFHPSHYPSPWPLVPLESPYPPFVLQRRIPIHLLPKKLYVHDPWGLVNTKLNNFEKYHGESWTSKTYHIRTYTLSLPRKVKGRVNATSKAAAAAEDEALNIPETVLILPQETEGPTEQPAIRAFLPKRPRKLTEVPEAHLYLSPMGRLGTGHHSIVYDAELELPRDLFCESTYCKPCLDEQVQTEVDRLKESGEWEQRLNEAVKEYEITKSQGSPLSSPVQIPPRYVGFVQAETKRVPTEAVAMVATTFGAAPVANAPPPHFVRVPNSVVNRSIRYEGPVVSIHPDIHWQNPSFPDTICEHEISKKQPVPRTAKFRVAVKLSLPGDEHLQEEANNYYRFPAHFFQHWSGYNIASTLFHPTPIGALVPQFFGYYKPDVPSNSFGKKNYCSPILLVEHCGTPIRVKELSNDDRYECAALLLRFHEAGWLHGSFAERNILMQEHHPTCSPLEEDECKLPHQNRPYSFRLIDFGGSVRCGKSVEWQGMVAGEHVSGMYLFNTFL